MAKEKKEKKKGSCLKTLLIVIVVIVIIGVIAAIAGGGDDEPTVVDNDSQNSSQPQESEPEKTEFSVGETVELNDVQVTLVSSTESAGSEFVTPDSGNVFLLLEFEIANNSDSDITISSIANFEAYCDDYSVSQDIVGLQAPEAEGKNQLDGSVAAGKKMNGVIAYQVPSDYSTFEISVSPDFWSANDIKFVISK